MKKLALLLGSLLVVGTAAQAKEVVAPVEVEVVEEVVVIEEAPAFRPSGSIGVEYRGYGKTEGHKDDLRPADSKSPDLDTWNRGANKYSRLQTTFNVQATENFRLEARIRDYNNLGDHEDKDSAKDGTQTRFRAFYKHDDLLTSRLQYLNEPTSEQSLEYQLRINAYKNEGGLLSSVIVAPKYSHVFPEDGNSGNDYQNRIGMNIELLGNLPFGFTWENNYYFQEIFVGDKIVVSSEGKEKSKLGTAEMELYLYNTVALWSNDTTKVNFNFEGGYDPYSIRQYSRYDKKFTDNGERYGVRKSKDKTTYSLYTLMTVSANYTVTENVSVYAGVGAEYRNWLNEQGTFTNQSSASHWRWQPVAFAGTTIKF